ncbi:MAG: Yip1 family protein [Methanolinea sp.]|jgi:hypothetical protein
MINLLDLLARPERFFSSLEGKEPDLRIPAAIAIVGAIIAAIAGYAMSGLYTELYAGIAEGMGPVMGIFIIISAFIGFLVMWWLVMAVVFFLISLLFKGRGKFTHTLANTGYGLVPVIIGSIVTTLVFLSYLPRIVVPVIRNIQDPAVIQEAMQELMHDPAMMEYTWVSMAISALFLLWSANIWIFGVKQARNITLKQACITVAIPVGAFIIYTLYIAVVGVPIPGGA